MFDKNPSELHKLRLIIFDLFNRRVISPSVGHNATVKAKKYMLDETKATVSIYHEPISEQQSSSSTSDESPDEMAWHLSLDASVVPCIAQHFVTHEEAYEFSSQFAEVRVLLNMSV